jgi:hypothetical protein
MEGRFTVFHVDPESVVEISPLASLTKQVEIAGQEMPVIAPIPDGNTVLTQELPESVVTRTSPASELLVPEA